MTTSDTLLVQVQHSVDSGVCTLTAAPAGPAGLLALDVVPGLRLRVDRLDPRLLVDLRLGRDVRGAYPAGALDVVRLVLGGPAAAAADEGRSGQVPFSLDPSPRRAALLAAVRVAALLPSGPATDLGRLVELTDRAAGGRAPVAGPSPALDALALRSCAQLAAWARTLTDLGDPQDPAPFAGWEAAHEIVRRRLGELGLGPLDTLPVCAGHTWSGGTPVRRRDRVLVGDRAAAAGDRPHLVHALAMRLPTALRGRDETELLTAEVVETDDDERPYEVRVVLPRAVSVDLWLRVADPAGTPLLHVRDVLTESRSAVFPLPAECGVAWAETHLEVLTSPAQPPMSLPRSTTAVARALAALALQREGAHPEGARRLWAAAAHEHRVSGRYEQALMALDRAHPGGGPEFARAARPVLDAARRRGPGVEADIALATLRRWRRALPADAQDQGLGPERQAAWDAWVLRRSRTAHAAHGPEDLLSRSHDLTVLFGCADTTRDDVRLSRAVARLDLASEALRTGARPVLHELLGQLVEDYDVLDEHDDLKAEVARLRRTVGHDLT